MDNFCCRINCRYDATKNGGSCFAEMDCLAYYYGFMSSRNAYLNEMQKLMHTDSVVIATDSLPSDTPTTTLISQVVCMSSSNKDPIGLLREW